MKDIELLLKESANALPQMSISNLACSLLLKSFQNFNPIQTNRPWGFYIEIGKCQNHKAKLLFIQPHCSISLQTHTHRFEEWFVLQGTANIIKNNASIILQKNEIEFIKKKEIHKISNNQSQELIIFEIQTGKILEESDIIRI